LLAHLSGCAVCRQTLGELHALDQALSRAVQRPRLSPDFEARLRRRIQTEPSRQTSPTNSVSEQKQRFDTDYQAQLRRLRSKNAWLAMLLDALGFGVLVGGFAQAAYRLLPDLVQTAMKVSGAQKESIPILVAGCATALVAGILVRDWVAVLKRRSTY